MRDKRVALIRLTSRELQTSSTDRSIRAGPQHLDWPPTPNEQLDSQDRGWLSGRIVDSPASVPSLVNLINDNTLLSTHEAILLWDPRLGKPDENLIQSLLRRKIDVWHSGLLLGMSGLPHILDFASPTWVFNRDPDYNIEASSWRLSLEACLIRTQVIQEIGFIHPSFQLMASAALELGYRYLRAGALLRHTPMLVNRGAPENSRKLPIDDELLFLHLTQEQNTKYWALARSIVTGHLLLFKALKATRKANRVKPPIYQPYPKNQVPLNTVETVNAETKVTVLIPTVDRYPYLRTLLGQLRQQTIKPLEIVVIDQTEQVLRDTAIADDFSDLPLRFIFQDNPGQCSSRNAGLHVAQGDYILFLDDDVEIESKYIENHLQNLCLYNSDTSSGKTNEVGTASTAERFTWTGISSVFPSGNTLIRKSVLNKSGLFDMAYDRGQSADGDLGMRIYLTGALMIYNSQISVLHHRAPSGGLRKHKARVITYSSSRNNLLHRRFPHITEVYRVKRYFTARQVHEALWMSLAGTFSIRGGKIRKLLKILVAFVLLPNSIYQLRQRAHGANELLTIYPEIAKLD